MLSMSTTTILMFSFQCLFFSHCLVLMMELYCAIGANVGIYVTHGSNICHTDFGI